MLFLKTVKPHRNRKLENRKTILIESKSHETALKLSQNRKPSFPMTPSSYNAQW